jgi:hypothetical protein
MVKLAPFDACRARRVAPTARPSVGHGEPRPGLSVPRPSRAAPRCADGPRPGYRDDMEHVSVAKAQPFDESGYRGIILPVPGHGRLAVLVKDGEADLPRGGARRSARQARDRPDRVTARPADHDAIG